MRALLCFVILLSIFSIFGQTKKDTLRKGFGRAKTGIFFKRYFDFKNVGSSGRYAEEEKISDRISFPFESDGYSLVFADYFDSLNHKTWLTSQPWGRFHGQFPHQYYDDSAVEVHNGQLYLQNRFAPKLFQSGDTQIKIPYGVGMVNSCFSKEFTYGYFAIRAKNPAGSATWPAFWLTGKYNWPPEIDIFENLGRCDGSSVHTQTMSLHYGKIENGTKGSLSKSVDLEKNTDSAFHVYACLWEPDQVTFFTDGIKTKTIKFNQWIKQFYQEPMYIIINNAVDKGYISCLDNAKLPVSLVVDWVMVFQKESENPRR